MNFTHGKESYSQWEHVQFWQSKTRVAYFCFSRSWVLFQCAFWRCALKRDPSLHLRLNITGLSSFFPKVFKIHLNRCSNRECACFIDLSALPVTLNVFTPHPQLSYFVVYIYLFILSLWLPLPHCSCIDINRECWLLRKKPQTNQNCCIALQIFCPK